MITDVALIQKTRSRWIEYVMLTRWRRADRVNKLLKRLECRQQYAHWLPGPGRSTLEAVSTLAG